MSTKFIFVTGGVVSGLGKGITAAALGRLLKQRGLKVAAQKLDPYMNVDPGTMSPFQHGEVFVTDDGAETDLDLGHYERFIDENLTNLSSLTSGRLYWKVLENERNGKYLGGTVQIIPHVTNEIKNFIYASAKNSGADVLITEIGGTVGDIESQPYLEAIRQISLEKGRDDCLFIHVSLLPYLKCSGEHKSKPTQHSVKEMRSIGLAPDIIIIRADEPMAPDIHGKIALFCNVKKDCVIENRTLPSLYDAPLMLHKNGLDAVVCRELKIDAPEPDLSEWRDMTKKIAARKKEVTISIIGKYIQLHDAYLSIIESLNHAGFQNATRVNIRWLDSQNVTEQTADKLLAGSDGMIVPGGFGDRGIDGKIAACRWARENDIPYLGICLGMQIAVIEYARNVCGLEKAHSSEFDELSPHRVIDIMPDQIGMTGSGGTMRLGAYPCKIVGGTTLESLYKAAEISERHRHRYEFNNDYKELLEKNGMKVCGHSPDGKLVEAIELPGKRFFVGVQFHPEFKSRPNRAHPLFSGLVAAALEKHGRDWELETKQRVKFIRELLETSGASGVVYGNSGGKDSVLVGILCKKACDNTLGVIMPCASKCNYESDKMDALAAAEKFGIDVREVDLTDTRRAITGAINTQLADHALANIAPRLRMTTLYAIAGAENRLVAGTGNRSERHMGYFTKWGDGAFDFNPIGDLTVKEIYEFLCYLEAPPAIIEKAPSAGLFEGQTDEQEMGITYAKIDDYLLNGAATEEDIAIIERYHKAGEHKRKNPAVFGCS